MAADAHFLDAGLALAASGRHVVALWHSSDRRLEVAVSDDPSQAEPDADAAADLRLDVVVAPASAPMPRGFPTVDV